MLTHSRRHLSLWILIYKSMKLSGRIPSQPFPIYSSLQSSPEKAMGTHSSTLAWKISWTEEPGRLQSRGREEPDTTERLHFHFSLSCTAEGNGNPLQCSCLENPRDRGAWWAAVYGVAQSQTRLKQLSSSSSPTLTRSIAIESMVSWISVCSQTYNC